MTEYSRGMFLATCEDCNSVGRFDDRDKDVFPEMWAEEQADDWVDEHPDSHDATYEQIA